MNLKLLNLLKPDPMTKSFILNIIHHRKLNRRLR